MKRLTIGMPVYNGATTIAAALDSLLAQSFADFDLIISDNGSTDETQAICETYAARDPRVRYVRQPQNLGPQMNFRFVLFEAKTPYFMWAAADDLWAPAFAARNIAALDADPGLVMSVSRVLFTARGVPSHLATGTYPLQETPRRNAARFFRNPADNSRFYGVFRTAALQRAFPDRAFHALDWAVSAATTRDGRHNEVPETLMIRDSSDTVSYARAVLQDHRFLLWRIFPVLFMTKWLLLRRKVPISLPLIYHLFRLNLYMHFRFGLYRIQGMAERYVETHSLSYALRLRGDPRAGGGLLGLGPGIGRRIKQSAGRYGRAVWRRLPISMERRERTKAGVFRLLGRHASRFEAYQGWTPMGLDATSAPLPEPGLPWEVFAKSPEAPRATIIVVGDRGPGGALFPISYAAQAARETSVSVIWAMRQGGGFGAWLFQDLPGIACVEFAPAAKAAEMLNTAVALARTDNVLIVPSEATFAPALIPAVLEGLTASPLIAPQILLPDGRLGAAGGFVSTTDGLVLRGRGADPSTPAFAAAATADFAPGALALRRDVVEGERPFGESAETMDLAFAEFCLGARGRHGLPLYWPVARVVLPAIEIQESGRELVARFGEQAVSRLDRSAVPGGLAAPRLLYVDAETPMPDRNSGSLDAVNLMRILKRLNFDITFVPESNFALREMYTEAMQKLGVKVIHHPHASSLREVLVELGPTLDVVVLCRAYIAERYIGMVRELAPRARIIFYTVDLHFLREMREAEMTGDANMTAAAERSRDTELRSVRQSDLTIVLSRYEQELLTREAPGTAVAVVPLLRDIPPALTAPGPEGRRDILFVGTYQHPPNVDAAVFFARAVWPLVRPRLPEARFLVAGSALTPEVEALAGDGVEVLGFVPDLDALMAQARVSVAPLRYGAGLKGKVASALQAGLPTVATAVAAEGSALRDRQELLIADTPEAMAESVLQLYTDTSLWRRLARQGFAFVRREYSIEANTHRIADIMATLGVTTLQTDLILAERELAEGDEVFRPSAFWTGLGREHTAVLAPNRLLSFKRSINNCYMQWLPGSFEDPRMKLPLAAFVARPSLLPIDVAVETPAQPELAAEVVGYGGLMPFANPNYLRFYAFYTGLVWYLMTLHATDDLHERIEEPSLGSPIVIRRNGKAISQDLAQSLLEYYRIRELVRTQPMSQRPTILELGAGYGRLAYVFLHAMPCRYVIVDIPPTIVVAKWYLSAVFPEKRVFHRHSFVSFDAVREEMLAADIVLLSPNQFALLPDGFAELSISISSLHEMRLDQITRYKAMLQAKTSRAIYIKQWRRWANPADGLTVDASTYLLSPPWRMVLDSTDLANEEFVEQGWHRDPGPLS